MDRRYGKGPTVGGSSKASATTLCQKCLKRGHYSYECKAVTQERPYVSRASRTQQFFNPKLVPKLNSDVPQDLLRKKGVADEQLAKVELARSQKRDRESEGPVIQAKRMRSESISTVSTSISRSLSPSPSLSRSPSPRRANEMDRRRFRSLSISRAPEASHRPPSDRLDHFEKKRRRRYSHASSRSPDHERASRGRGSSRSTRRRLQEASPASRGRRRTESRSPFRGRRSLSHDRQRNNDSIGQDGGAKANVDPTPKERSLSPFSRRMALTHAMNKPV